MAAKNLDRLLADARKAYRKRDSHTGAQLINEILQEDFKHAGAWQLLHRLYGSGQLIKDFQRSFTEQYFPDKLDLLDAAPAPPAASGETPPAKEKPAFLSRLLDRGSKELTEEKTLADEGPAPPPKAKPAKRTTSPSLLQAAPKREPPPPAPQPQPVPQPQPAPVSPAAPKEAEGEKIRVLVVDDIAQTRDNIIRSFRFQNDIEVVGSASNGEEAIQLTKELKPEVVIMDVNMPDMDGITATKKIRLEVPSTQVVILTVQDEVEYIRSAMMAGARDFLTKPPMGDELVAAVQSAGAFALKEKSKASAVFVPQAPGAFVAQGRIITLYSPRGGAGCTTLAANLAAALHDDENQVVIVDGNLQFGDVPIFFNVHSKISILDLAPRVEELDSELVEEVLVLHSSGIKILSPPRPENAEAVSGEQFSKLLKYLGKLYPYVIVDTAHMLTDITLAAFDASMLTVLVTSQDIPSIARARKFLDLVPLLNINPESIIVVMNQYDERMGITPEKVSQAFGLDIAKVLPFQSDVVRPSVNRGNPFMLQRELLSRPIARAITETTQVILQRIEQLEKTATRTPK